MTFLALFVATSLGVGVGFGIGRFKSWLAKHEEKPTTVNLNSPLLRSRLRLKGGIVRGVTK